MSMRFVECFRCSGKGRVPGLMWGYDPCDSCAAQGGRYVDDTPPVLPITEADVRRIVREELALLTGDTGQTQEPCVRDAGPTAFAGRKTRRE